MRKRIGYKRRAPRKRAQLRKNARSRRRSTSSRTPMYRSIRSVVRNMAESKRIDAMAFGSYAPYTFQSVNGSSNTGFALAYIPVNIPQGAQSGQRIGNAVTLNSIAISCEQQYLTNSTNGIDTVYCDWYLCYYKPGLQPTTTNLMIEFMDFGPSSAAYNTACMRNQSSYRDFVVLRRKRIYNKAAYNAQDIYKQAWIKWKGSISNRMINNSTNITECNTLFLLVVASPNVLAAEVNVGVRAQYRLYFKDF